MEQKQLIAEIDGLLARMPKIQDFAEFCGPADVWLGQANAVLSGELTVAERSELRICNQAIEQGTYMSVNRPEALRALLRLTHTVRYLAALQSGGTGTVAIDQGMHYQYFDAIKGLFETAVSDLLVVDPYLNQEVLKKYCVYAKAGVAIRLLGTRYMDTLQPAAAALNQQRGNVHLRKSADVHDRYVFVEEQKCFLSGASFKNGPQNAPSVLTEITDYSPLHTMYEAAWDAATVVQL